MSGPSVRPARVSDLPALNVLYNHYVETTPITFDVEPVTLEEREAWFRGFGAAGPHRLLVAESGGELVGYACSHRFRPKRAYDTSVETTVYAAPDRPRRGIGSALYTALLRALADEDVHRAYAGITLPNPASIALHERFGFRPAGTFDEVGRKFGRWWSVRWYERPLP